MLADLNIRNFAIIDDLQLHFEGGFNVLTGETGAGKSIILDAVSLVIGERADISIIRAGSSEAYVEAIFQLAPSQQESLRQILADEGLDGEDPGFLILARELRSNGRSICRVNGRAVNLSVLRQIGDPLIDIHGQGEHLSLSQPRSHLPLLDAYGDLEPERRKLATEVRKLNVLRRELDTLLRDKKLMAQRLEMLDYQIRELGTAGLQPGEEEELRIERTRLANAEQLSRQATEAVALLTGVDDDTPAAVDLLGRAESVLTQLAKLDDSRGSLLKNLQGLSFQVTELAGELQDYLSTVQYDPDRLDAVEERLELIGSLKRKYGLESIAALLDTLSAADQERQRLQGSEVRTAELEAEQEAYLHRIGKMASSLSTQRQETAETLSAAVVSHLKDLKMEGARFGVEFTSEETDGGCYTADGRQLAFDQTGYDRIEFVISANPGEPLKPLAKVASGGETSRLMLALKTALAQVDATPTLIFDEIDQGIGGRVGDIVGRKLWGLSAGSDHQVIVVTHLPQLAGYGDAHFHVSKEVGGGRTTTAVESLNEFGRVRELAEMLGTQQDTARDGAESILRQVKGVKTASGQSEPQAS